MPSTLPQYTKAIDNYFTETWFEIKPEAIDNIMLATPIWALLKEKGCFSTQVGGTNIEETIKYAVGPATTDVVKGDVLGQGEIETESAAFWTWRYKTSYVQRSAIQDQQNNGKFRIKDYVKKRLTETNQAMSQQYELDLFNVGATTLTDESGKKIQSLNELLPSFTNKSVGTYGGIARPSAYITAANGVSTPDPAGTNPWWGSIYKSMTLPPEVNLLSDMKTLYNAIGLNQEYPNMILVTQNIFEIYEEFALDQVQIIKDATTYLADLGFEVLRFKGKPLFWTPNFSVNVANTAKNSLSMFNTDYIKVKYDPNLWFDMGDWKPIPLQLERIAHIISCMNIYTNQPRRHGRLYGHASDGN